MNGYEKRTHNKRDAIITAAQELFAENGIAAVSITDIAAKANVSRVTLFKYFGNKEALAKEVVYSWIGHLMAEYDAIISSDMPLPQKLLGLLNTKLAGREKIGEQFIRETAWDDPGLLRLFKELAAAHALPKIMQIIDEGKRSGDIAPNLDNEAILTYFSAFGPIVKNPEYIKKGKAFQTSLFNLFMGGLIKNWYSIIEKDTQSE
jgi:AcrR family transcriptional regulator